MIEIHIFDKLFFLISAVYLFLFLGTFLDFLDTLKKGWNKKDDL